MQKQLHGFAGLRGARRELLAVRTYCWESIGDCLFCVQTTTKPVQSHLQVPMKHPICCAAGVVPTNSNRAVFDAAGAKGEPANFRKTLWCTGVYSCAERHTTMYCCYDKLRTAVPSRLATRDQELAVVSEWNACHVMRRMICVNQSNLSSHEGAETHRAPHRARQRTQRFSAMYILSEGRQGRGGLRVCPATTVSSTSSLRC